MANPSQQPANPINTDARQFRSYDDIISFVIASCRGGSLDLEELVVQFPQFESDIRADYPALRMMVGVETNIVADLRDQQLGQYRLIRQIGRGGMGTVYKATHPRLDRPLAIKVLNDSMANRERTKDRFEREAQTTAKLNHPNIVGTLDYGVVDGRQFIVMPFIDGRSLEFFINLENDDQLRQEALSCFEDDQINELVVKKDYQKIALLGAKLASALSHAHENDAVHRDIKPANLILDRTGEIWVTDFGLAKLQDDDSGLSRTGDLIGTPRYMAPEQLRGIADEKSDVYGLGLTLYELALGKPAWSEVKQSELGTTKTNFALPSLADMSSKVPYSLARIIDKACAFNPEDRYENAKLLKEDLNRFAHGETIFDRRTDLRSQQKLRSEKKQSNATNTIVLCLVLLGGLWLSTQINVGEGNRINESLSRSEAIPKSVSESSADTTKTHDVHKPLEVIEPDVPVARPETVTQSKYIDGRFEIPAANEFDLDRSNEVPELEIEILEGDRVVLGFADDVEPKLTGVDANQFLLVDSQLEFNHLPDFEDPVDSDVDRKYEANLEFEDANYELIVRIKDRNEPPAFRAGSAILKNRNTNRLNIYTFPVVDPEHDVNNGVIVSVTGGPDADKFVTSKTTNNHRFLLPDVLSEKNPQDANSDGRYEVVLTAKDSSYLHVGGIMHHESIGKHAKPVFGKLAGKRANLNPLEGFTFPFQSYWIDMATSDGEAFWVISKGMFGISLQKLTKNSLVDFDWEFLAMNCGLPKNVKAICTHDDETFFAATEHEELIQLFSYKLKDDNTFEEIKRIEAEGIPLTISSIATCDGRMFMVNAKTKKGSKIYYGGLFGDRLVLQPPVTRSMDWRACSMWIQSAPNANSVSQPFSIKVADEK